MLIRGQRGQRVAVLDWMHQEPPLPTRLEPGDRWSGIANAESMKQDLDRHFGARSRWSVRPLVGDSTGRGHKATPAAVGWRRLFPRRWMKLD